MPNRTLLAAAAIGLASFPALSQTPAWPPDPGHPTINLWPTTPPDPVPTKGPEGDTADPVKNVIAGRRIMTWANVSRPTITLYSPKKHNTGATVVVFPGGGYNILAIDLEGTEVCDWLTAKGVNCVLLKYRVPDTGPYMTKSPAALEDAQRAVGLVREMVRSHAGGWEQIDPNRIGVLGFSAGGHLAVALSTHYDKRLYPAVDAADQQSCRPDFAVVVYPGYLADAEHSYLDKLDIHPTAQTPPAIIIQAEDDPVHVENSTTYFLALKAVNVPAELHLYAKGGHGYGLRRVPDLPVTTWPEAVETWLHTIHILK